MLPAPWTLTHPQAACYAPTGGTITIGDGIGSGLINLNVGSASNGDNIIYSNINVAGGKALEIAVSGNPTASYVNAYQYLNGTNTFGSLTIDNSLRGGTGATDTNLVSFNDVAATGLSSFPAGANVTMGAGAGLTAGGNAAYDRRHHHHERANYLPSSTYGAHRQQLYYDRSRRQRHLRGRH